VPVRSVNASMVYADLPSNPDWNRKWLERAAKSGESQAPKTWLTMVTNRSPIDLLSFAAGHPPEGKQ
jgi:hypothetical protein